MENNKITSDFRYSLTLAFLGLVTSSYLQFVCTTGCLQGLHGAFRYGHSKAWLPPLLLTGLHTAMCMSLLRISFSRFQKDKKSIESKNSQRKALNEDVHISDSFNNSNGDAVKVQSVQKNVAMVKLGNLNGIDVLESMEVENCDKTVKVAECISSSISTVNKEVAALLIFSHACVSYLIYFCAQPRVSVPPEPLLPVTTTFLYFAVMGRRQSKAAVLSTIVMTVGGIAGFNFFGLMSWDGYLLVFPIVVLLSTRNIAMKLFHEHCITVEFRSYKTGFYWILFAVILNLSLYLTANIRWMMPCIMGFLSSAFFLANSYLSVVVILRQVSLISHAVIEISKHLLIAILLAVCNMERLWFIFSLSHVVMCSFGLFAYVFSGKEQTTKQVSLSEQSTRLFFVVFLAVTFGFLFHNIPLQFSERDLANLEKVHLQHFVYYIRRTFDQSTTV